MGAVQNPASRAEAIAATENVLDSLFGYNLKRAYVIFDADFRRAMGEDGFTPRSFSALATTVQYPDISQSELARLLGIERSGLVTIIDDLEGRGYVERQRVPGDRRAYALRPTAAGQAACARAFAAVRTYESNLLSGLDANAHGTLMRLLRKIRQTRE